MVGGLEGVGITVAFIVQACLKCKIIFVFTPLVFLGFPIFC